MPAQAWPPGCAGRSGDRTMLPSPGTVTLIANYIPLEEPAGGPNFRASGDDVQYDIDNDGDGCANITCRFSFTTEVRDENPFLDNTGRILSLDSTHWNRRQTYTVSQIDGWSPARACSAPCDIGPLSTPHYKDLAADAVHDLRGGTRVFLGQRAERFYIDLGAIFDVGDLRQGTPDSRLDPVRHRLSGPARRRVHNLAGPGKPAATLTITGGTITQKDRAAPACVRGA
jgi:hypothetical protein